jgi:hypothetical protein
VNTPAFSAGPDECPLCASIAAIENNFVRFPRSLVFK